MTARAAIALGSNLGNRLSHLRDARELLRGIAPPGSGLLQAPIYQTAPVNCPEGSPDFYNTVVEISFEGSPHQLLDATQAIEFHLGRSSQAERNAPRIIDLDILCFGDSVEKEGILEIPHPRLTSRRFVLQPLADIRPGLILPGDQVSIAEHLQHLDSNEPPLVTVQALW